MAFSVGDNCYAVMWSYGEICVGCNCCGRYDDDRKSILTARLEYHSECLNDFLNFSGFVTGKKFRRLRHRQGMNNLKNIKYERKKINEINKLLVQIVDINR